MISKTTTSFTNQVNYYISGYKTDLGGNDDKDNIKGRQY